MGLHILGFLVSLLVLLPNLAFFLFTPRNVPEKIPGTPVIFTIFERAGQAACFLLPILFGKEIADQRINLLTILMAACLIIYYSCWGRYFAGGREFSLIAQSLGPIPIPMAIFPVLYFLLLGLWLGSMVFVAAAIVLAVGHLVISWNTYNYLKKTGLRT
jgi:hypothetical protein